MEALLLLCLLELTLFSTIYERQIKVSQEPVICDKSHSPSFREGKPFGSDCPSSKTYILPLHSFVLRPDIDILNHFYDRLFACLLSRENIPDPFPKLVVRFCDAVVHSQAILDI